MINPAFAQYPEEARLLGELVLGYGELDISFCMTCGIAIGRKFELLHAVNQVRSETGRLDIANALSANTFVRIGLWDKFNDIQKSVRYCLKVRNQWAHAQWGDMRPHGLAFTRTDGNVFATPVKRTVWNSVTVELLRKQEAYFEYTRKCIIALELNLAPILAGGSQKIQFPDIMHEPSMLSHWSKAALEDLKRFQPA